MSKSFSGFSASSDLPRWVNRYRALPEKKRAELRRIVLSKLWVPLPGPQYDAYHHEADVLGFGGAGGGSKALALDTPLPTPNGWTTMGSVQADNLLFDERGQPCRVVAVSEVFLNHQCYELEFDDGEKIVADAEHRWVTFTLKDRVSLLRRSPEWQKQRRLKRPSRVSGKKSALFAVAIAASNSARAKLATRKALPCGTVVTTREIAETLHARPARPHVNHSIVVAEPLCLPDAVLPVPPYTLGAWLGDGKKVAGKIYVAQQDEATLRRIEQDGFEVRRVPSDPIGWTILKLQPRLRSIGVLGAKHIPAIYLRGSYAQRLELLRGLMDTDGCCALDGGADFSNTNRCLADGVLELVRSLGIKATLTEGQAMLYGKDCGPYYRVKTTTNLRLFNLERKAARQKDNVRQTQQHRYVVACRPVPSVPVRCVAVDSPSHLYLAGRSMIPTHNTDLLLGLAITRHRHSLILRREGMQLRAMIDRSRDILGTLGRFNEILGVWRDLPDGRQIEFGGVKDASDIQKYRGRPHSFLGIDEADQFTEFQVRFLQGWVRTTMPGERCRVVMCFNPPASAEGRWLLSYFAPWLDPRHLHPATSGELRWYAMVDGKEVARPDGESFEHGTEIITPRSRTFIPAKVTDNPFLMSTGYVTQLQALPEPLRSQLLHGDFRAGLEDDPWQTIPTAWVEAAQARWTANGATCNLEAIGVDVARGGSAQTVLARRYGPWFARLEKHPGSSTPDGPSVVRLVTAALRENPQALVNVDVIGIGSSPVDWLRGLNIGRLQAVNFGAGTAARDKSGMLGFCNVRAYAYWLVRELLDPASGQELALPPDPELLADLTAVRWSVTPRGIKLEEKAEVAKRIGRSPDCGDACVLSVIVMR